MGSSNLFSKIYRCQWCNNYIACAHNCKEQDLISLFENFIKGVVSVIYSRDMIRAKGKICTGTQKFLATSLYIRLPQALWNLILNFGLMVKDYIPIRMGSS